ncbi:MAG: glutamate--tRNA ligase family protein, partial [Firmicutes bacterium]|nr:glutamate--tRNA ligase family protein [Bacillota bacterium]
EEAIRKQQGQNTETGYYGKYRRCHNLTPDQIEKNIKAKKPFTIRFRNKSTDISEKIDCPDVLRGNMSLQRWFKDEVLIKSDGIPVYHFAVVVDDYLMGTTTVVRGSEWLASFPLHVEIWRAFGFDMPKFLHTMLLCKQEGTSRVKISKRKHPDAKMQYYIDKGYPKDAIIDFVYVMMNSSMFEQWRKENPCVDVCKYKLETNKMSTTEALWDLEKLNHVSRNHIAHLSAQEVYKQVLAWAWQHCREFNDELRVNKSKWVAAFNIEREQERPRADIAFYSEVPDYFDYLWKFKGFDGGDKNMLAAYAKTYNHEDDKETWFSRLKEFATSREMKVGQVAMEIRRKITGKEQTPDLWSIMQILGVREVLKRLN